MVKRQRVGIWKWSQLRTCCACRNQCEQPKLSHKAGWSCNKALVNTSRPDPLVESQLTSPMGCKVLFYQKFSLLRSTCAGAAPPLPLDTGSGWSQFPATHLLQVSCFGPNPCSPQDLPWAESEGMNHWLNKQKAEHNPLFLFSMSWEEFSASTRTHSSRCRHHLRLSALTPSYQSQNSTRIHSCLSARKASMDLSSERKIGWERKEKKSFTFMVTI